MKQKSIAAATPKAAVERPPADTGKENSNQTDSREGRKVGKTLSPTVENDNLTEKVEKSPEKPIVEKVESPEPAVAVKKQPRTGTTTTNVT